MKTHKGKFKPKNPSKYRGDPTNIIFRSWWEFIYMSRLDSDPNIKWWSSEEKSIPYRSPVDNKIHRYYPDFIYSNGVDTYMIEIKPLAQTKPPVITENKKKSNKYIKEVVTWGINNAKWEAAKIYCHSRNYKFRIITEVELGL